MIIIFKKFQKYFKISIDKIGLKVYNVFRVKGEKKWKVLK